MLMMELSCSAHMVGLHTSPPSALHLPSNLVQEEGEEEGEGEGEREEGEEEEEAKLSCDSSELGLCRCNRLGKQEIVV